MNPQLIIESAIFAISLMLACLMAIAWLDFDRPRHALTWSISFALVTLVWALALLIDAGVLAAGPGQIAVLVLRTAGTAGNTIGFRQRAHRPTRLLRFLGGGIIAIVATLVLQRVTTISTGLAPLDLFEAAMLALSAATLVGRRRGEKAVQRIAYAGLVFLATLSAILAFTKFHAILDGRADNVAWLSRAILTLLPATVTATGLTSIFLLTADQADQTRRLAATDLLTGLLNRRGFEEAATQLMAAARNGGRQVSLAVIDIDRFKDINDSFGHQAGDRVIARFAAELSQQSGRRDLVARMGGEEFAMMMADVDLTAAVCAAEVTRDTIARIGFDLPDGRVVTASFGLVELPKGPLVSLADLLARADEALYQAKEAGRNRVVIYNSET